MTTCYENFGNNFPDYSHKNESYYCTRILSRFFSTINFTFIRTITYMYVQSSTNSIQILIRSFKSQNCAFLSKDFDFGKYLHKKIQLLTLN